MKERIYTIPLSEAFDADTECAFCKLYKKLDEDTLKYTLGASYMEEDVRENTDKIGFCKAHYKKMYDAQNRLGLSLILSTHLKKLNNDLKKAVSDDLKALKGTNKRGLLKKKNNGMLKTEELISSVTESCFMCEKIANTMERYTETFFFLWKTEPEFRNKVLSSKGFCLEHYKALLNVGDKKLGNADYEEFVNLVSPIMLDNLKRVEEELLWFIDKFDYRYANEPWKNSKNSLQRSIIKTAGITVDEIDCTASEEEV